MQTPEALFDEVIKAHGITGITDFSRPASYHVQPNGLRFRCLEWGSGGQPILFLHGGGQDSYTWDFVCLQLRDTYHCYAMDMRNHGESDTAPAGGVSPLDQAEDVKGVIGALGLKDPLLVGMSMGGIVAMTYASRNPGLKGLVIVDVTPTVTRERRQDTYAFNARLEFDSFEEAVNAAAAVNPHRPEVHLRFSLLHMLEQRPDGKWNRKRPRVAPPLQPSSTVSGQPTGFPMFEALWDEVAKISYPTLIVHGMESNATDYGDAERLGTIIPKARVVHIPGASHTVQGDKPKPLAEEIRKFIRAEW